MGCYIHDLNLQKSNLLDGPHVYSAYILVKPGERSVIVVDNEDGESSEEYEIITVPPHGRLGDLDDFAKRMKNLVEKAEDDGFDLGAVWYSAFARHIELTPTIIEAEEASREDRSDC